jgi:glucose-6-phosphate dehydrogenase assembly protein OpcA
MTHVAWVPAEWLAAARRTLDGMAAHHPSRTLLLFPEPDAPSGIAAELSVRCFPVGDREICGEVIELHLRGDRVRAPASIVVPLAISDLPVFLRWRGEPPFRASQWSDLVTLADRVIVDSSEWGELRYDELAATFPRTAVSDLAWARIHPWRVALARRWPAIARQDVEIRGPRAEAALLRAWLGARLDRALPPVGVADELGVRAAGEEVAADDERLGSPSDLLSAELDHTGRDTIYEEAVARAAAVAARAE